MKNIYLLFVLFILTPVFFVGATSSFTYDELLAEINDGGFKDCGSSLIDFSAENLEDEGLKCIGESIMNNCDSRKLSVGFINGDGASSENIEYFVKKINNSCYVYSSQEIDDRGPSVAKCPAITENDDLNDIDYENSDNYDTLAFSNLLSLAFAEVKADQGCFEVFENQERSDFEISSYYTSDFNNEYNVGDNNIQVGGFDFKNNSQEEINLKKIKINLDVSWGDIDKTIEGEDLYNFRLMHGTSQVSTATLEKNTKEGSFENTGLLTFENFDLSVGVGESISLIVIADTNNKTLSYGEYYLVITDSDSLLFSGVSKKDLYWNYNAFPVFSKLKFEITSDEVIPGEGSEEGAAVSAQVVSEQAPDLIEGTTYPILRSEEMYSRLKGKIILKVEANGEAFYISPDTMTFVYLGGPAEAFREMRNHGVGITNSDLEKIPIGFIGLYGGDSDGDGLSDMIEDALGTDKNKSDTDGDGYGDMEELISSYDPTKGEGVKSNIDNDFANKQKGKILLQVEGNGEAWYVNPADGKRYFLGRPADAFEVMRNLGLGISNENFEKL